MRPPARRVSDPPRRLFHLGEESRSGEGLRQVARPRRGDTLARRTIVVGGDEDDGDLALAGGQMFLQVETRHLPETNVEDEAVDATDGSGGEKLRSGGEGFHDVAFRFEQTAESPQD